MAGSADSTFGAGMVHTDQDAALRYLRTWHGAVEVGSGAADLVSLVMLPSRRSLALPVAKLVWAIETNGLDELVYPAGRSVGDGAGESVLGAQNLYVSAGMLKIAPERGRRGGKDLIGRTPGIWMDLDVREGGFSGWAEVWGVVERFDGLGLGPGIVVSTGGGGAHLYWHVGGDDGLAPDTAEELGRAVRLWTQSEFGVPVDSCENADRVLRLPGSVHWPKAVGSGGATPCALVRCEVRQTEEETLFRLTAAAVQHWQNRTKRSRARYRWSEERAQAGVVRVMERYGTEEEKRAVAGGSWAYDYALAYAAEGFAEETSWDTILEPKGWRRNGAPDREGRVEWTRPGGGEHSGRSLVTDWMESPHVGSLLSMAPETGLRRLYDAGIPLTKARVAAELWFNGNLAQVLTEWLVRRQP